MRNSGTTDALTKKYMGSFFEFCSPSRKNLKVSDPTNDPLLRLQYLARIGWQYDLADVAALIVTPSIVSLFVWRDSFYSLDGTTILVRTCDLKNVWIRFIILLFIKPAASYFARSWIRIKMRRTLLGKKTMHGTSQLAAKIMAERKLVAGGGAKAGDAKVEEAFAKVYVAEELLAVKDEVSLSGLNFKVLRSRVMRKWKFYFCVVIFQLFSAFPCHEVVMAADWGNGDLVNITSPKYKPLPVSSAWLYVPPIVGITRKEFVRRSYFAGADQSCTSDYLGWAMPNLTIVRGQQVIWPTSLQVSQSGTSSPNPGGSR